MSFLSAAADTADKASGTSDYRIAYVGLFGVILGALFGLVGTWITTRQNARLTKQAELRRLYADFFEALNAQSTMQIQDQVVDELLKKFHDKVGSVTPTRKQIEALGPDQVEAYLALKTSSRETNEAFLDAVNRLEHLKYQAQLLAPMDTSSVIDARVAHKKGEGSEVAATLRKALVTLGRRDLSAGRARIAGKFRAARMKKDPEFKAAMKDFYAFTSKAPKSK